MLSWNEKNGKVDLWPATNIKLLSFYFTFGKFTGNYTGSEFVLPYSKDKIFKQFLMELKKSEKDCEF